MREFIISKGFFSRYSTISKALKAASAGDRLLIKPGVYEESLVIDKAVEIVAEGNLGEVVINSNTESTLIVDAAAVCQGLKISYSGVNQETTAAVDIRANKPVFLNCTVAFSSSNGVIIDGNSEPVFNNCQIFNNNRFGLFFLENSSGEFENCSVYENRFSNIKLNKIASPKFSSCKIYASREGNGVYAIEGSLGEFRKCAIYANSSINVYLETSSKVVFEASDIYDSKMSGIYVTNQGEALFKKCNIYGNQNPNVYITESAKPVFESCRIYEGKTNGVMIDDAGEGIFRDCEIFKNVYSNVTTETAGNPVFEDCKIYESAQNGIWICSAGKGSFLNCDIYGNSYSNVKVEENGEPLLTNCLIHDGLATGILVKEGGKGEFHYCKSYSNKEQRNIVVKSEATLFRGCSEAPVLNLKEMLSELEKLVGLQNVKSQISKTIQFLQFNKEVSQYGINAQDAKAVANHTVLMGSPGTGKTTVARLLGKLYVAMGLLPSGHVVAVNREKLVAQYIGQTAPKTKEAIEQAMGGILFIDEAYELSNKGKNDFGPEALAVLLEEMENRRGQFIVVVAGYEEEMQQFLQTNPGLKSRFNQEFKLEDYTPEEMQAIALKLFIEKERVITTEALELLTKEFTNLWRKRDRFFANARVVRNIVEKIMQEQAERCMETARENWNAEFLTSITVADVQKILDKAEKKSFVVPIQEELLNKALQDLEALIGLTKVKNEINKLVTLVRYYREEDKDIAELSPHTVLQGSPGTGKTEVARIIARIYEALGILERGELVEINRDKVVSSYAGESEKLISKYIDQAIGGVLFIDEAYQLTQYGLNDPGHKVIEVLLKYLEDRRGEFIVIVAGYPSKMAEFLQANDGLQRRFIRSLEFEDYNPEQLMQIGEKLLQNKGYKLSLAAQLALDKHFSLIYAKRDASFGNAGLVRNLMTETIKNLDYRVAQIPKAERNALITTTILEEDLAI